MAGLQDLLRASTDHNPDHPLYIAKGGRHSYGFVEQASGRVASALLELGVRRGDRVALVLDRTVDYLIAYYAIAKAGAVVVPLCSDTRAAPLKYALAHSGARAVILDGANAKYLAGQLRDLPELRFIVHRGQLELQDAIESAAFETLLAQTHEYHDGAADDDLLTITYTSGTTGKPKGVMLSHANVVANVRSIVEYLELSSADRVAMVLPYYYVYGNSVLHTHVCAGASIVDAGSMTFPAGPLSTIETERCTGFSGVPSTFARLVGVADLPQRDLRSLRYVTQAGAAMTPALTARLRNLIPAAKVFVMYGQTEASARLAYLPPADLERKMGSVGKAIPNVELAVVSASGERLGPGQVGEVVARGPNVMRGYWRDEAATQAVLRDGCLYTGDLGSMDDEGYLFIVGREREMIKSGAHRISPQEIEEVVAAVDGVAECAVTGVPDELLGQAIAAFIVPDAGRQLDRNSVLRACLAALPRFKLPQQVRFVDHLPRTASGKLQRRALTELL